MFKIKNRNSPGNEKVHYNGEIQHTEFSLEAKLNGLEHNIVKYICRYKKKGTPILDLRKVMWHLETLRDYIDYLKPGSYILSNFMNRSVVYSGSLWETFVKSQKFTSAEVSILENALFWILKDDFTIEKSKSALAKLMEEYEPADNT